MFKKNLYILFLILTVTHTHFGNRNLYRKTPGMRSPSCISATLTPVTGSPFSIGSVGNTGPQIIAYSPNGAFAAVANNDAFTAGSVSVYSVNQTSGIFTPVTGSAFAADDGATVITFSPNGAFAAVTAFSSNPPVVDIFQINQITGALTPAPGSPFAAGVLTFGPSAAAFSPNGSFLAVTNSADTMLYTYTVNPTTGALTPLANYPTNVVGIPDGLAFSPDGDFLAVSNGGSTGSASVSVYAVDTFGNLTEIIGSPFAGGNGPFYLSYSPNGAFLAVANSFDNTISVYSADPVSGVLTQVSGSPFLAGNGLTDITFSPNGNLLAATNNIDNTVSLYTVDQSSGILSTLVGSPFPTGNGPYGVDFAPNNNFIAVTNSIDNTVSVFSILLDPAAPILAKTVYLCSGVVRVIGSDATPGATITIYANGTTNLGTGVADSSGDFKFISTNTLVTSGTYAFTVTQTVGICESVQSNPISILICT